MIASALKSFWQEEDGQDMVEYALLAFVALAAITVLGTVKTNMQAMWTTIAGQLTNISTQAAKNQ